MIESIDDTHMKTLPDHFCKYQSIIIPVFTAGEMPKGAVFMGTAPKQTLKEQVSKINRILYEGMHKENSNGKKMNRTLCKSAQRTRTYVLVQTQGPLFMRAKMVNSTEKNEKRLDRQKKPYFPLRTYPWTPWKRKIRYLSGPTLFFFKKTTFYTNFGVRTRASIDGGVNPAKLY